jgi:hypothetical protein
MVTGLVLSGPAAEGSTKGSTMTDDLVPDKKLSKMDNLTAEGAEKRPAPISPCKSGSHDVAEPAEGDTTCHTGREQDESPPENDLPSDSLLGE